MLDDDIVALVLVGDLELVEQVVRGLADHHGGEQLAAQPGAATGGDVLLDDRNLCGDGGRRGVELIH